MVLVSVAGVPYNPNCTVTESHRGESGEIMANRSRKAAVLVLLLGILGAGIYFFVRSFAEPHELSAAQQAMERRDFREASQHLDKHLAAYPKDLDARLLAAQTARRQGDFETANRHLQIFESQGGPRDAGRLETQMLAVQQGDLAEVNRMLAFCRDRPEAAETPMMLEAVIVGTLNALAKPLMPHSPFLSTNGPPTTYLQARDGIDLWLKNRSGSADRAQGLVWRARARELGGVHAGAIGDLREALALDPEHYEARVYLSFFVYQEAPKESAAHLEILARRYPEDLHIQMARANCCRDFGHLNDARQIFDRLLIAHPTNVGVLMERGRLELDANRPLEAEVFFRRGLARAPEMPEVFQSLSSAMRLQGKTAEAQDYQKKFEELEAEEKRRLQPPEKR